MEFTVLNHDGLSKAINKFANKIISTFDLEVFHLKITIPDK